MPSFSLKNSTTVRKSLFSGLEALSPALAAQVAMQQMFRTQRRSPPDWERKAPGGQSLVVRGPRGGLAVERWGSGPLVMLVHGWNGRRSQLGAFVEPLVQAGFQVVAFDAPGCGASYGTTSSLVDFANAFDAVLDAVRPFFQPLHGVIAHSMGGPAVMFALKRAEARADGDADSVTRAPRLVFFAPPINLHDFVNTASNELGLSQQARDALLPLVERRLGERMADLHALRIAHQMRSPLLVLHDEQDRAIPMEWSESLVARWPGAELVKTSGLGHNRILRDAAAVTKSVDFIAQPQASF